LLATTILGVGTAGPVTGGIVALATAPVLAPVFVRLAERGSPRASDPSMSLVLDLVAAALRGGRPLAEALELAAPAAAPATAAALDRVARLLRLGADPGQAWAGLTAEPSSRDDVLAAVAPVAVRSARSGLRLAAAFERLAAELRSERGAAGAARAHRAGVLAMGPLAACFLPSFVCLGIVPVVVGIASTVIGVAR
jgi:Flp pilus assembly protein TadB